MLLYMVASYVTLMPRSGNRMSGSHVGTLINPAAAFWELTWRFRRVYLVLMLRIIVKASWKISSSRRILATDYVYDLPI